MSALNNKRTGEDASKPRTLGLLGHSGNNHVIILTLALKLMKQTLKRMSTPTAADAPNSEINQLLRITIYIQEVTQIVMLLANISRTSFIFRNSINETQIPKVANEQNRHNLNIIVLNFDPPHP